MRKITTRAVGSFSSRINRSKAQARAHAKAPHWEVVRDANGKPMLDANGETKLRLARGG